MNHLAWDDLESIKNMNMILPQEEEEFSQYFQDRENFDSVFNEALATLQDLDVPSGYGQTNGPMSLGISNSNDLDITQKYPSNNYSQTQSPYRHSKKPSGTAIFGFMDHNRELSFSRSVMHENIHSMKPIPDTIKSISPTQLAKTHRPRPVISNEQLEYNFNQELDECKPIHLAEEDEHEEPSKKEQDIIVTNNNPKSYKFPPDPPQMKRYNSYMSTSLGKIHHPKQGKEYPEDISGLVDEPKETKGKKYVPIPVQEPDSTYKSSLYDTEKRPKSLFKHPQKEDNFLLDINNVCLPPPSSESASQTLSSSPLHFQMYSPQAVMREAHLRQSPKSNINSSPMAVNNSMNNSMNSINSNSISNSNSINLVSSANPNKFYNPQFFSDDGINEYYSEPIGHLSSSPIQSRNGHGKLNEPQSSPLRKKDIECKPERNENVADETVTDINETIVQLTPLKQNPMTPNRNKITLEWSPIISPNGKASQVRKAIHDSSPRRQVKTTSLLPPGELDRYWEGPDQNKVFICTYKKCGKKFTRRYNVRSHIQTHLSDRPFKCTYCPKNFVRQHDLNRHVKSHMMSKHVKCRCGREFTRVEGYKKHLSNGVCSRISDSDAGISKPGAHRLKIESMENILDGLTSNRLNEELGL